jgi:hypothetical protein
MSFSIIFKNGHFKLKEALESMDWDTAKFEKELEIFAKTQPPEIQEKLRKQYNKFMRECGCPMRLVVVPDEKADLDKEDE